MIICIIIVIPKKKPRFQKEFIWRGQGYDCKCDFISNTKYNFQEPIFKGLSKENSKRKYYYHEKLREENDKSCWTHQREGREHLWNLNLGSDPLLIKRQRERKYIMKRNAKEKIINEKNKEMNNY